MLPVVGACSSVPARCPGRQRGTVFSYGIFRFALTGPAALASNGGMTIHGSAMPDISPPAPFGRVPPTPELSMSQLRN